MNISSMFGKKKQNTNENVKDKVIENVANLSNKINDLEEKIKYIETKKNNLNEQAKTKLKSGDKNGARQALAKKKKLDEQIKQFDGAIMLLEENKMMLENAESMKSIFETVKKANSALVEAQKGMSLDDLEKLRDQMEDMKDTQKEMSDFFQTYATTDDTEIEDELNELANEIENDSLPKVSNKEPIKEKMPTKTVTVSKNKNDEDALNDFLAG